jgi:hypothetical protein
LLFDVLPGIPTALRQQANPGCAICACLTTPRTGRENYFDRRGDASPRSNRLPKIGPRNAVNLKENL